MNTHTPHFFAAPIYRKVVRMGAMVSVLSADDLLFKIKEQEIVTGLPGRTFVTGDAGSNSVRMEMLSEGIEVRYFDEFFEAHREYVYAGGIDQHWIGRLIDCGALFAYPYEDVHGKAVPCMID